MPCIERNYKQQTKRRSHIGRRMKRGRHPGRKPLNWSSTVDRVPRFGLHRTCFICASEKTKTAVFGALEIENVKSCPERIAPLRPAPEPPCPTFLRLASPEGCLGFGFKQVPGYALHGNGL